MDIQFFEKYSFTQVRESITQYINTEWVRTIILLICDDEDIDNEELNTYLQSVKKTIFGGIFPGIILNKSKYNKGFIVVAIDDIAEYTIIENISSSKVDFHSTLFNNMAKQTDTKTMFVIVDGLSKHINLLVEALFTAFGLDFNYIGGGAGSLSFVQKPCVISNRGLLQDAAILVGMQIVSGIGVKHGWESVAGPFKITSASDTEIKELDFKPAFDVYKPIVEAHSRKKIDKNNFFESSKSYPFGINKLNSEKVVRDPLILGDERGLICVGDVETGSFVDILNGTKETLINAAKEAAGIALNNCVSPVITCAFFVDCISRVLFLEDDFEKEIEAVQSVKPDIPLFGVLSIGEIANNGQEYLEFYNKTSVVAYLY